MIKTIQIEEPNGIWTFDVGPITSQVNPGWLVFENDNSYSLVDSTHFDWTNRLTHFGGKYLQIYWTDKKLTFIERQTLFFDMDGVLCDFEAAALKLLTDKGLFREDFERSVFKQMISDCQDVPGFYRNLPPIPGALEAFKTLSDHYDCYICSAPSWTNPSSWTDKQLWVLEHLGEDYAYKKLILTHNKGMFTGRALIDDRVKYNVPNFKGEHIMFGTGMFSAGWKSIVQYLLPHRLDNLIVDPTTMLIKVKNNELATEYILKSYVPTGKVRETVVMLSMLIHFKLVSIEDLTIQMMGRWTIYNEKMVRRMIKNQQGALLYLGYRIEIWTHAIGPNAIPTELVEIVSIKKPTQ